MGLMQGKVQGTSIIIMDSFALPVQGTETRVNAQDEANTYMVEYRETGEKVVLLMCSNPIWAIDCEANYKGWEEGACYRVVSLSSWVRMLVVWH
jgi:COP9 signalosome complex subunit 5